MIKVQKEAEPTTTTYFYNSRYINIRIQAVNATELEARQDLLIKIHETVQELKKAQIELEKDLVSG